MKLLLPCIALCGVLAAQTPTQEPKPVPAPAPKVEPAKQEPAKQDPAKQEPAKQEPAKKDPAKQEAKAGDKPITDKPLTDKPATDKPVTEEPKIDRPAADQPIPKGTDPADIAAMRSAEQMLQAEKRLADEIKAGKIAGLDKILPFDELDSWPYEDGLKGMPKRVKELDGKKVLMTGFMLPIDEVQNIKEFLLVKSLWSCCYGQPPDIPGIVRVVMPKGKTTDYFFDPLKIVGTFKVEATVMDGYCVDIYQLHVESLEALRFK
ncbi:MAG: DUF3299 domain-containing protein [Planctomycetota bacterium]